MSKAYSNKRPLLVSLSIHVILIGLMAVAFVPTQYRLPGPVNPEAVIRVRAVAESDIQRQMAARKRQQQARRRRIERRQRAKQQQRQRLKQARLARLKRERLAIAAAKKKIRLAKIKRLQLKQARLQRAQQQRLLAQSQLLSKRLMAARLRKESSRVAALQARQQKGIINRYVPQILTAISEKWLLPPGINPHLSCLYQINLAPGGVVVGVKLLSSSGSSALDRSANQAIWSASPLPVPNNPALFDKLRLLRLTMRPENAMIR